METIKQAQELIDERRLRVMQKFDFESGQGILPFTNEKYFEQSNPIVRSALFSAVKMGGHYSEWTQIFSFGAGSIMYRGPALTIEHEAVLARLMLLARGKSLTKPVSTSKADIRRWLELDDSGENFKKARRILDDLAAGEIKISCKLALRRLYHLLTSPTVSDRPDGKFFKDYIDNRYGEQLKMIAESLAADTPVEISMSFITNETQSPRTGRSLINLDPITAIFFDGVNTTLLPFEIWDTLDRFGKKMLPYIASHRDGVYPTRLESYHLFSGSISKYSTVKRRVKSDMNKRLKGWEEKGYIEPGWSIYRNDDGDDIVKGLKPGPIIGIRSELLLPPILE